MCTLKRDTKEAAACTSLFVFTETSTRAKSRWFCNHSESTSPELVTRREAIAGTRYPVLAASTTPQSENGIQIPIRNYTAVWIAPLGQETEAWAAVLMLHEEHKNESTRLAQATTNSVLLAADML